MKRNIKININKNNNNNNNEYMDIDNDNDINYINIDDINIDNINMHNNKKNLIIRPRCGLTNQLTCIAKGIIYAHITNRDLFIDNFQIKGNEKKSIIISTIKKYLEEQKYENIEYIIHTVCPELIDILISVDKRKIMIKKRISCLSSCFAS